MKAPAIDSDMSREEAVLKNLPKNCPPEVLKRQAVIPVHYHSFDKRVHTGQIVLDERLAADIEQMFEFMFENRFPVESVIPISDERFLKDGMWSDELSMRANNTSAFNYRKIAGTDRFSYHALGMAIDINPLLNPFVKDGIVEPRGAVYAPERPGTFTADHPVVGEFKALGWTWGGGWHSPKDYQHFEKVL